MKLPQIQNTDKYTGLYIIDFDDETTSVGFTANEVARILESEKFKDVKVYKIHRAYPDGQMEIKGIRNEIFQLESGLFFYSDSQDCAQKDFKKLQQTAIKSAPPCRAKLHLSQLAPNSFVTALIYPAEFEDEISNWLMDAKFKTQGPAQAGIQNVSRYYDSNSQILERHQLFAESKWTDRSSDQLLQNMKKALQR